MNYGRKVFKTGAPIVKQKQNMSQNNGDYLAHTTTGR